MPRLLMRPALALCGLAAVHFLASQRADAASDPVPRLNVERSCRDAEAVSSDNGRAATKDERDKTFQGCMQDEREALTQLRQKWSKFKPNTRSSCLAQGAAPSPSYVEILTCLEMNNEDTLPYSAGTDGPPNMARKPLGGSPPARPPGSPSPGGSRL